MKSSELLERNRVAIREIIKTHHGLNARVFGSVLRGEDTEISDLDILVEPAPEMTIFDIGAMRHELAELLGIPVDVRTPCALPDRARDQVIAEAMPV